MASAVLSPPEPGAMVVWCHPKGRTVTTGIVRAIDLDAGTITIAWDDEPTNEFPRPLLMWHRGWIRTLADQRDQG